MIGNLRNYVNICCVFFALEAIHNQSKLSVQTFPHVNYKKFLRSKIGFVKELKKKPTNKWFTKKKPTNK